VDIFGGHDQGESVSESEAKAAENNAASAQDGAAPSEAAPKPEGVAEAKAEGNDVEALRVKLADAQGEVLKVRDQLLRTAADFDNFRKRTRKDVDDAQRKGLERALLEVLPVADNLERAVQAAQQSGGDMNSVIEGVRMVLRFFEDAMSRLGVEKVPSVGQAFDPGLHEAVQHVESDQPAGTVISEMTPGYKLGGKLLRAALVGVARPKSTGDDGAGGEAGTESSLN
jgi:molecular chaperone GrpE